MKPIIFSTPEAQALLNTKPGVWPAEPIDPSKPCKSQTRRVMKPQLEDLQYHKYKGKLVYEGEHRMWCFKDFVVPDEYIFDPQDKLQVDMSPLCKYARYQVGDKLWVRETWQKGLTEDEEKYCLYKADGEDRSDWKSSSGHSFSWKPSVHMPREAARLFLEVKAVRVERLQYITPLDAFYEGIMVELSEDLQRRQAGLPPEIPEHWKWETKTPEQLEEAAQKVARNVYMHELFVLETFIYKYEKLWNSINAKRGYSWDTNPWVFVYEFMRVER